MKTHLLNKDGQAELKFPCLMINNGSDTIVLMTRRIDEKNLAGVRVGGDGKDWAGSHTGYFTEHWNAEMFELYDGKVALSNDLEEKMTVLDQVVTGNPNIVADGSSISFPSIFLGSKELMVRT